MKILPQQFSPFLRLPFNLGLQKVKTRFALSVWADSRARTGLYQCTDTWYTNKYQYFGEKEKREKRKGGRRKEDEWGKKRKQQMRKKEEEEEETRPYLRCGDAVRSQQAKVTIDSSIRGNSCKRCGGGARVRSGKLIRWVGPRWVHVPINARTSMCQPFCTNLGKTTNVGWKGICP